MTEQAKRERFEEMMGYAPPTEEEREFRRDHWKARKINDLRDEGQKADYFHPREAGWDGYCTSSSVKSILWNVAQEHEKAAYVTGPDCLRIDAGEGQIKVAVRARTPYSRRQVVAVWATVGSDQNRICRLEPDDLSFHTGRHGIQWGRRWKEEDVEEIVAFAFQAALEDASSLLSEDTKVYNA